MKIKMAFVALIALPALSEAKTVYKFQLQPNDKVAASCIDDEGQNTTSKINIAFIPKGNYIFADLKAKVCTHSYGYRRIVIHLNIPKEAIDASFLASLAQGQSKTFNNIPVAQNPGAISTITISRLPSTGKLVPYSIKSSTGAMAPVRIYTGTNKSFAWSRLQYTHQHPLAGSFTLDGYLTEIASE